MKSEGDIQEIIISSTVLDIATLSFKGKLKIQKINILLHHRNVFCYILHYLLIMIFPPVWEISCCALLLRKTENCKSHMQQKHFWRLKHRTGWEIAKLTLKVVQCIWWHFLHLRSKPVAWHRTRILFVHLQPH